MGGTRIVVPGAASDPLTTAVAAADAAQRTGFPVTLRLEPKQLADRLGSDGVRSNLVDQAAVTAAFAELQEAAGDAPQSASPMRGVTVFTERIERAFVRRLRIYPHALREANAYYSPDKRALLFGYFPATGQGAGRQLVFSCLSHDIIAHETTHALLDGIHRRYQDATNPEVLAFHEALADIVAIFQHFTFPELIRFGITKARGDLRKAGFLAGLARQFGQALGRTEALRSAIGTRPDPSEYAAAMEPHDLGRVLVAAV